MKDVFICSLGAYGGPEAHYGVFLDQLVAKRKYLTEQELVELIALTGILPVPAARKRLLPLAIRQGGLFGASDHAGMGFAGACRDDAAFFSSVFLSGMHIPRDVLRLIGPMAVGFIITAAFRIGRKVIKDALALSLFLFGCITTYLIREPWVYPAVLLLGGAASVIASKEKGLWNRVKGKPALGILAAFGAIAAGSLLLAGLWDNRTFVCLKAFIAMGIWSSAAVRLWCR